MRKIWDSVRAYAAWLISPRLAWFTSVAIVGSFAFALLPPRDAETVATAGTILQLIGSMMGFSALNSTRKLFGARSLADEVRAWFGRRPKNITMEMRGTGISISGGHAEMSLWHTISPDMDTSQRIDALVANVEQLRKEASAANLRHQTAIANLRRDVDTKTRALEMALSGETVKLRDSQTGGLWMATAALLMIVIGTVLAGFSNYIANWTPPTFCFA
jgi:hypothetical protein